MREPHLPEAYIKQCRRELEEWFEEVIRREKFFNSVIEAAGKVAADKYEEILVKAYQEPENE